MAMSSEKEPILKKTLYAGTKNVEFKTGTKVFFHFQTKLCDKEQTILDDSRKMGKGEPLNIVLGKKFTLEVWEVMLQKMALNEVAQFTVDKALVAQYPIVSKTLREMHKPPEKRRSHCCAMTLQTDGVGYSDLNEFMKNPVDLEFIMEIVKVEQPEDYEKETWQMDENEQIDFVPKLKNDGNEEYKKKNYAAASELYAKAIGIIEQLMVKEKPNDVEWNHLNKQKMPLLLNYSQCKLHEEDYYPVIEHCTEVIKFEPENVKAYFRRAKAHVAAWNPKEAKCDFEKVIELDPTLQTAVKKELENLENLQKIRDKDDKEKLKNLFTS